MNDLMRRHRSIDEMIILLLVGLFIIGNSPIIVLMYCLTLVLMIVRTWLANFDLREKFGLSLAYLLALTFQLVFWSVVVLPLHGETFLYYFGKVIAVALTLLPLGVERFVTINRNAEFYLPSVEDITTISLAETRASHDRLNNVLQEVSSVGHSASPEHLKRVLGDLHRHSATQYINNGSLTPAYFAKASASLADPNLYLVISNTGSDASQIISVFTKKIFNHASIAFDRDLATIISYNGGANVYPPGLNAELLTELHQKDDASVLVYSLSATSSQKKAIIDKIAEINQEGSAYNIVGLVIKSSFKPNIMFCSQFVYNMLQSAGLAYFEKKPGSVRPTDLIELDYYKKLKFEYEIKFK